MLPVIRIKVFHYLKIYVFVLLIYTTLLWVLTRFPINDSSFRVIATIGYYLVYIGLASIAIALLAVLKRLYKYKKEDSKDKNSDKSIADLAIDLGSICNSFTNKLSLIFNKINHVINFIHNNSERK